MPHLCATILLLLTIAFFSACNRQEPTPPPPTTATAPAQPVPPSPKPIGPLAANASCITPACHSTFQTAAHIHGPIAAASCFSCHQADQGNHHYPLARSGNATCTFCHVVSGSKVHQHPALQPIAAHQPGAEPAPPRAGCLNCHDPHVSRTKFLLVADTVQDVCAKCHNVPLKKYAHEPFAAGQCTVCHDPHESDFKTLLRRADGPEQCFGCHVAKRAELAESPHVHAPAKDACTTCHSPHSTDNIDQLKLPVEQTCFACHPKVKDALAKAKFVHGALTSDNPAGGNCASCHDAHADPYPHQLKARTDKVCLICHTGPIKTADGRTIAAMGPVLASKYLHGPVRSGDCSSCHHPHAADLPELLTKASPVAFYQPFDVKSYALCFSCHDQQMVLKKTTTGLTNFRNGSENLHYVHVNRTDKGRTCKTCHEMHGSDLPNHMASTVPFDGSNWPMPIGYQKTADGGSCTPACHDEKTYRRNAVSIPPAKGGQP